MAVDGLYLKSAEVSILAFLSGCRINNFRRIIKVGWSDPPPSHRIGGSWLFEARFR